MDRTTTIEPAATLSTDITEELKSRLKEALPEFVVEGELATDRLLALLGQLRDDRRDRYTFTWAGKQDAIRLLQTPTAATLAPDREDSVNFDETANLFIEGDNLEVLKLLYKPYFNRVKMIYIDPPYNTGNDYVYPDNYQQPLQPYLELTGQVDTAGNLLSSNPESGGRYHSSWLNMMYPRLFIARQLLSEDGTIFVSIDDHEVYNLRLLLNEIFGEENFVAQIVWEGALKNDSKLVSESHDYIVCYARNREHLRVNNTQWRTRKEGIDAIYAQVEQLKEQYGDDYDTLSDALNNWYRQLDKNHPAWSHRHYRRVDARGVYFPSDISWPGGGGPKYEVLHPQTGQPVKVPARGWVFPTAARMQEIIDDDRVYFHPDPNRVPTLKRYLHETEGQVLPSVFYQDRRGSMKRLRDLFGKDVFDNPKDEQVILKLAEAVTQDNDLILDFFAGSCTTAHSVMDLNALDGGHRRFIMVQLPEPLQRPISLAKGLALHTVADIGKERIRRVIARHKAQDGHARDSGFRVFKLRESNIFPWAGTAEPTPAAYSDQLELFTDPLRPGAKPIDIVYEIMLKEGYPLTSEVEQLRVGDNIVFRVRGTESGASFFITLDDHISPRLVADLALDHDDLFICRDVALDDTLVANLALQCRVKTI